MADVVQIPKIQCDGCGVIVDKVAPENKSKEYDKPRDWGACRIDGSRNADAYGNKERLYLFDLCPGCATAALRAAHQALKKEREDYEKDREI